jgi:mRNA-degrading endonuclease YafQ of YafQ-DinJ toxin-antitoxin module
MTEQVDIRALSALDTKLAAPTSMKDLGATMKDIQIRPDALLVYRVAKAVIAASTRR